MVLNFFLLASIFLFTSCTDFGERDNPDDPEGINYVQPINPIVPSSSSKPSSSSALRSSSSAAIPSSSSAAIPSKGNNIASYKIKPIGEQVWMAENLDYDVPGSKCYGNDGANCAIYGRLYDWETAMKLPGCNSKICSSQIDAKHHQGICPDGWHIPSNADWDKLFRHVDGTNGTESPYDSPTAGRYLKAASGWDDYQGKSGNGENKYGFSALPGGGGNSDGSFSIVGTNGSWWSASEYDSGYAITRYMGYYSEYVYYGYGGKVTLFSVRCVQD